MSLRNRIDALQASADSALRFPAIALVKLPGVLRELFDLLREMADELEGPRRGK